MAKSSVFLRTPYNYDVDAASNEAGLSCDDVSLAKQSFKEECDINVIVDRFGIGYDQPEGVMAPTYGDFTNIGDFSTAMAAVVAARESFMTLPADARARFANDPQAFVEFCSNDANASEVEKLGLMLPEAVKRRADARAAEEAARIEALVAERMKQAPKPA